MQSEQVNVSIAFRVRCDINFNYGSEFSFSFPSLFLSPHLISSHIGAWRSTAISQLLASYLFYYLFPACVDFHAYNTITKLLDVALTMFSDWCIERWLQR